MPARSLPQDPSFSSLREEVSFSLIRLGLQKGLKGLGKALTTASQRLPGVEEQQYEVWNAQVSADAQITFADDGLDDFVVKLANEAKAAGIFELFFSEAPTRLARPVLGDQLQAMRPWVKQLEAQSDKRFAGMPAELKTLLAQADAAIKSREDSSAAAVSFRKVGAYRKLVDQIAAARDELWAELDEVRRDQALPRDFAERFFKRASVKVSEADRAAKAESVAKARAEKLAREAAIKEARTKMKAALAEYKALAKKR
ncbi:MAG: hypothetical protein ABTQ32_19920 [Myxococcaceae bacterium]|jgi:hypothetical protein